MPEWAVDLVREGYEHFGKLDMPSDQEEVWRYVELGFDLGDLAVAQEQSGDSVPRASRTVEVEDALDGLSGSARIIDGHVVEVTRSNEDVIFAPAVNAMRDEPDIVESGYGKGVAPDLDVFAAAHDAFGLGGMFVHVPRGKAVEQPFLIEVDAVTPDAISFPRVTINVADGAEASVVVSYQSPDETTHVVVPRIEALIGTNANLKLTIIQNWGYDTHSLGHARLRVGRDGALRMAEAGLGGKLSRLHLTTDLVGRGSTAEILGAYIGEHSQTHDYRYFMHHEGLDTRSDMFLKGAVEDEALSVFTGMIRIDEGAQRTKAFQTNRNLILSDGAAAQSVPNLEILANDVRCGHGSTVGPLDEEQRYYLMSRGLPPESADRLQVRGFFEEVLAKFPTQAVVGPLRGWINDKYITAQEEGRV